MLELGQPTHPYDLARLPGRGLSVRRARPGETVETLDGVERTVGVRGRSLGDTGEDCLICDAEGTPVGIGGIMGGASSEIAEDHDRGPARGGLLHARWPSPARPSASACAPRPRPASSGAATPGGSSRRCGASASCWRESVPGARGGRRHARRARRGARALRRSRCPSPACTARSASSSDGDEIARLIGPIGFTVLEPPATTGGSTVVVPTNRPDVRPEPYGVDDVIEEIARTFGYSNVPRHVPTWPQPGRLTAAAAHRGAPSRTCCGARCLRGLDRHLRLGRPARRRRPDRRRRCG